MLDLSVVERRGRLVEHDYPRVVGDCLGDLDHLPLGDRHLAHDFCRIDLDLKLREYLLCFSAHLALARDKSEELRVATEPEVIGNAPLERLIELLMYHRHAILKRILRASEGDLSSVEQYLAAVESIDAEKAFHQRGFSRAVLAHQRVDTSCAYPQSHPVKRLDAREALAYILHFK